MAESVSFWLENKQSIGSRVAQLGDQGLVNYRDRYYVVMNGAALMKGGKPLRYSISSLPAVWKKALRGYSTPADVSATVSTMSLKANLPGIAPITKSHETSVVPEQAIVASAPITPGVKPPQSVIKAPKSARKPESKQTAQTMVNAECPYCSHKQEIPVEKGRSGKPFFNSCIKCRNDFAVKFVQVTMYQAQVAGFR